MYINLISRKIRTYIYEDIYRIYYIILLFFLNTEKAYI